MAAKSPGERFATLETKLDAHFEQDRQQFAEIASTLKDVRTILEQRGIELAAINHKLDKQKGFIAGVIFVVSALWAVGVAFFKLKTGG